MNYMILKGLSTKDKSFIKRHARKIKGISYLGKFCHGCGKNLYIDPWSTAFHHKDPSTKDYTVTDMISNKSWPEIKRELDKCVLMCADCHYKLHFYGERFKKYKNIIYGLSNSKIMDKLYQRKATSEEICNAKTLFRRGFSYKEISKRLRFKESTLRIWMPLNKYLNLNDPKNEKLIIDLYEIQKKTLTETCNILHCTSRTLRRKIIDMVRLGRIASFRKNVSNQYLKTPKKVSINGKVFNTVMEASRELGIGGTTIYYRIKNGKKGYGYTK